MNSEKRDPITLSMDDAVSDLPYSNEELMDRIIAITKNHPNDIGLINIGKRLFFTNVRNILESLLAQFKMQEVVLSASKEEETISADFIASLEKDLSGYEEKLYQIDEGLNCLAMLDGCSYDPPLKDFAQQLDEAIADSPQ